MAVDASSEQKGFELFDQQKLGASDFQQQVTYQRALEGEIARTIQEVDGVQGAQVQLVLPEDSLFADEETPATAAVMLAGPSTGLESGSVRGIAQLVASSVKGLKSENVTITDGTGQLLWPQGDGFGDAGGGSGSKLAAETRYERALQANLTSLLTQTLGPGKARVQVKADLNVDRTTESKVVVDGDPTPVQGDDGDRAPAGGGGTTTGGTAGTGANIPTYSANAAGGGANSNYQRESTSVENVVPRTVTKTDKAPGAVNKLQIALVVDKTRARRPTSPRSRTPSRAPRATTRQRGDVFQAAQVPFAKPAAAPKAGPVPVTLLGPLKWVGLGLATLIFLFFMARHLKKREGEALTAPAWLREIEEPTPLSQLEAPAINAAAPGPADADPAAAPAGPERPGARAS